MRFTPRMLLLTFFLSIFSNTVQASPNFDNWLGGVRHEAVQKGISQKTIDAALSNIQHNDRVITLDRKQPEHKQSFAQYKQNQITQTRIDKGRALFRQHHAELTRASQQYGVAPEFIVALWGMETNYGSNMGGFNIIEALATLAYDGRRSEFFRKELFDALKIIDQGHISASEMRGSWAGAMAQIQFMPSSFLTLAVDGNGDGKRDIWHTKADVFASAANYLSKNGWHNGERWGRKVKMTRNIPKAMTGLDAEKSMLDWSNMGVTLFNRDPLPTSDGMYASLVIPDGAAPGEAYLAYHNYRVIRKWNKSTYFVVSVGLLADLIALNNQTQSRTAESGLNP